MRINIAHHIMKKSHGQTEIRISLYASFFISVFKNSKFYKKNFKTFFSKVLENFFEIRNFIKFCSFEVVAWIITRDSKEIFLLNIQSAE